MYITNKSRPTKLSSVLLSLFFVTFLTSFELAEGMTTGTTQSGLVVLKASHPFGPVFGLHAAGFGPAIACVELAVPL